MKTTPNDGETANMPSEKVLCGILYKITVHEGLVVFEQSHCMWGCHTRMVFQRAEELDGSGMWYLTTSSSWDKVAVNHICAAYDLIKKVYGDSFVCKQRV